MGRHVKLTIDSLGSHGEGVGRLDGYTIFVNDALPTEVVAVELTEERARYAKAKLLNIESASTDRVEPICPLFGRCGGCQLMHLSYEKQLAMKTQKVQDALERIGKLQNIYVEPCIASPKEHYYRNKIQLPVQAHAERLSIGLYERNSHNLVEVHKCYIHNPLGEEVYKSLRAILQRAKLTDLRHILIKSSEKTKQALIVFVTDSAPTEQHYKIAKQTCATISQVKGVIHNCHDAKENVILGSHFTTLAGQGYIDETLCDLTFRVSPASFFQVNPLQAENLYKKALECARLNGTETVLDAYCGVGTLSLVFSKHAKRVFGVECVSEAIQDAKENARLSGIENVEFHTDRTENYIKTLSNIDVVILNPPRKGCEKPVLDAINAKKPKRLLYISCDPATLARDLSLLEGYRIELVQPFDMFPQTAHVETLCSLKRI